MTTKRNYTEEELREIAERAATVVDNYRMDKIHIQKEYGIDLNMEHRIVEDNDGLQLVRYTISAADEGRVLWRSDEDEEDAEDIFISLVIALSAGLKREVNKLS